MENLVQDQIFFSDKVLIEGQVRGRQKISDILINGRPLDLPKPRKRYFFNYLAKLEEGDNNFTIEAVDIDDDSEEKTIKVRREIRKVRALRSRMVVAIFPFYNSVTEETDKWDSKGRLENFLREKRRFKLVERAEIEKVLEELDLSAKKLTDPKTAIEARIKNADTLFLGTVVEKEENMEIRIRVVDTETTEIIATADVYGEDIDLIALQLLSEGLALKLIDELPLIEGTVLNVGPDEFKIDLNLSHKIKEGMKLIIFKEADQTTVKDLDVLGRAVIIEVEDHESSAKMSAKPAPQKIEPGYKVITR